LFNKKKKQAAQEAAEAKLRDEIRAELDAAMAQKADLEQRIAVLDDANAHLDARLAALDHGVVTISEQLLELSSANDATRHTLGAIEGRVAATDGRLDEINARLASSFEPPPSPPEPTPPPSEAAVPPPPPPATSAATSDDLGARVAELREQLDELARRTSSIDDRVTSVSLELTNQLTELGSDIDELARRDANAAGGDAATDIDTAALEARIAERLDVAIDDVLDSTERLAAEQARYQIQFRADLAELAERLRRPGA
jgi:small-conductance mechanosensitive channel